MSISPPSDIVLDVARAADATHVREAAARLGATAPVDGAFEATLATEAKPPPRASAAPPPVPPPAAKASDAHGAPAAYRDFEGMVLATLLESAMPQDSTLFGEGTGGSVWSSVFMQEVGKAIAANGGIGIAASLSHDPRLGQVGASPDSHAALALLTRLDLNSFRTDTGKLWGDE